jgi:hypothetical protein
VHVVATLAHHFNVTKLCTILTTPSEQNVTQHGTFMNQDSFRSWHTIAILGVQAAFITRNRVQDICFQSAR